MSQESEFKHKWRKLHHPSMNVDGDVSFYYGVYKQIHGIMERSAKNMDECSLLQILMYTENTASVSLDAFYERMYGLDTVGSLCGGLGMASSGVALIHGSVSQAVADAPESSLKRWVKECVLSGSFQRLSDVAIFFSLNDKTAGMLHPNIKYAISAFMQLAHGDNEKAQRMLESYMAFNLCDKGGLTLLSRLAERFDKMADGTEVSANLKTIRALPLASYLPLEGKGNGRIVTVMKKDYTVLDVVFPSPVSENNFEGCFVGSLVTYLGRTYVNGPVAWLEKPAFDLCDTDVFLDSACCTCNADSDTGTYNCGAAFSPDIPDILDFLNWLAPEQQSGNVSIHR